MRSSMPLDIIFAYILDLIFGDPRWLPHPVRGIGWLIEKMEAVLRRTVSNERIAGVLLAFSVIGITWYLGFIVVKAASSVNAYLGLGVSAVIIYSSLSVKDLAVESMEVYRGLEKPDINLARKKLSLIVGRDTHELGERDVVRATLETVSENIVDGIISPLFYAFIGGAPLALAYKAVNTLDSMVGYKNERYKDFGWASARIDTLANYIPARLSMLLLPAASFLTGKDAVNSWRIGVRDGDKNPSLNSGIPEACVAGALGVRLGGLSYYDSKPVPKPFIGDGANQLAPNHIKESVKIAYVSSLLFLICGVVLKRW